jgi:triphosphoribosyl-dephospho-CoA synthase
MELTEVTHNLTLACLLETSVPKPGNVSPTHAFHSTRYEHYLSGSVAVGLELGKLADLKIDLSVGEVVHKAVESVNASQSGGNTHLGIILLLAPLARAVQKDIGGPEDLRANLKAVLQGLDYNDTIMYYKAINLAKPGGLLPVDKLDVTEPSTLEEIEKNKISVKDWMNVSKETNSVSFEYISDYKLTFELGLPYINGLLTRDPPTRLDEAVLRTYLKFLTERLDSLVLGKFDMETAESVQADARNLLELYEASDPHAQAQTQEFHDKLTARNINPGMSADLTASTIFTALMTGLKI